MAKKICPVVRVHNTFAIHRIKAPLEEDQASQLVVLKPKTLLRTTVLPTLRMDYIATVEQILNFEHFISAQPHPVKEGDRS